MFAQIKELIMVTQKAEKRVELGEEFRVQFDGGIDNFPGDRLDRGAVVSMFDTMRPIVETFTDGDRIETFVFLSGIPIPYSLFCFFICTRLRPLSVEKAMPKAWHYLSDYPDVVKLDNHTYRRMARLWKECKIPYVHRQVLQNFESDSHIRADQTSTARFIEYAINTIFIANTDENPRGEDQAGSFADLIRLIDEAYAESLANPEPI